jgi:hypothetical protein
MKALVRFTAVMGPLSSVFDIATFALLLGVFHADVATFRSAWFVESMATQMLVVLVIRTAGPAWRERPHRTLLATVLGCLAVALALPFLPVAGALGFAPLSASLGAAIAGLVAAYLVLAEAIKRKALPATRRGGRGLIRRGAQGFARAPQQASIQQVAHPVQQAADAFGGFAEGLHIFAVGVAARFFRGFQIAFHVRLEGINDHLGLVLGQRQLDSLGHARFLCLLKRP